MKRIDVEEDEDDDYEILSNFKRIPSQYDESVEVVGADDVLSPPSSADMGGQKDTSKQRNIEKEKKNISVGSTQWQNKGRGPIHNLSEESDNSDDDEEDEEEDDDDDIRAPVTHGAYDPEEYEQLAVSEEIKNIFNYITKYTPQNIELDNKLCPFLPDYIPAVGDIDAFIKVPRPDGAKDGLGLRVLDEPCTQQSDPAVLQLQLRAVARQTSAKAVVVKKIENAEKNGKSIERWIKAISDLHIAKPLPTVQSNNNMVNLDNLMQEWPPEVEEKLSTTAIPNYNLDCDLSTYITIICNLFDIPVKESKIHSLHVFFLLYSTMKSTQAKQREKSFNKKNSEAILGISPDQATLSQTHYHALTPWIFGLQEKNNAELASPRSNNNLKLTTKGQLSKAYLGSFEIHIHRSLGLTRSRYRPRPYKTRLEKKTVTFNLPNGRPRKFSEYAQSHSGP